MRVLMITPFYHPIMGGVESVVENFSIELNRMGIITDVMTFNFRKPWCPIPKMEVHKINEIKVIKVFALNLLPSRLHSPYLTSRVNVIPIKFTRLLHDYDILHFHNDVDLSFPFFSIFIDKPKIFHCHVLDATYISYKRNLMSKLILRNVADIYIALSKLFANFLIDLGIPEEKIRILPNGIDVKKFKPDEGQKINNLLLFVGRLEEKKGLHVLLKALEHLETSVNLVIAGPPHNQSYYMRILSLIDQISQKTIHNVTYLGVVNEEEKLKLYQKASIFICPSIFDSFPMVNLEALSCGTPVVASNVGAISEVVRHQENGILVPPGDVARLAKAIQYLLDNEEIRQKFGEEGRKWIVKNYSTDIIIRRLCQIYKEAIFRKY